MPELNEDAAIGPIGEVSWSDESIRLTEVVYFKGEKAQKKRVFMMSEKPKFARVHYANGYFVCQSTFESRDGAQVCTKRAKCCELAGAGPKLRFGAVVLVYATRKDGTILTKDPTALDFEFQIWAFGEDKFGSLRVKNEEWGLTDHDLLISCTDEQYQKIDIDVMKSALWKTNPSLKARVEAAWAAYNMKDTQKFLGRVLSESEIATKLGHQPDTAPQTSADVNGQSLESVLAELQADAAPKAEKKAATQPATLEE